MKRPWLAYVGAAVIGGMFATTADHMLWDHGYDTPAPQVSQQPPLTADKESLTAGDVYRQASPGVVFVSAQVVTEGVDELGLPEQREGQATGSGFVIDRDGFVLTNDHVVDGAEQVKVSFADGRSVTGEVVGRDPSNDLALLKVNPDEHPLTPLRLGDSSRVQVGDPAVAIGNPLGYQRTLTTGVISALGRQLKAPNGFTIQDVIQTDAAINPGNSGGPLLDATGAVIAINSQIAIDSSGAKSNIGIGFAVPINTAKQVLAQLREGDVRRAYLGITGADITDGLAGLKLGTRSGVLVQTAPEGGPADQAGLRGGTRDARLPSGLTVRIGGDVIVGVDEEPVRTMLDVSRLIGARKPGDRVKLRILRADREQTLEVTLGTQPKQAG